MEKFFTTKSIFSLILRWKKHLAGIVVVACILAVVFSSEFFIEPKFESSAVLYPAAEDTFSDESESEQMIEILSSSDIMFKVIDKFNLPEHYDINEDERHFLHKLTRAYRNSVRFNKTAHEAVEILVRDKDPEVAAAIASAIIDFYNDKVLALNVEKSKELVNLYKVEKNKKANEIDSLANRLTEFRKEYGILHMPSQVERITEAIYKGRGSHKGQEVLDGWKKIGSEYHKTDSLFSYALKNYNMIKISYEYAVRDTQKVQTYAHVVSNPFPSDKKVYPIRWVIVLFSGLGAFFISLIIIGLVEGRSLKNE